MEPLARTFKALADPTRLRILNLLLVRPACVCELQAVLALPQSLLSRHLAYLRNAELVEDERQGMRVFYHLRTSGPLSEELRRFLGEVLPQDESLRQEAESWRSSHQTCEVIEETMTPAGR
jgi:ArsR family transcriptional regulator